MQSAALPSWELATLVLQMSSTQSVRRIAYRLLHPTRRQYRRLAAWVSPTRAIGLLLLEKIGMSPLVRIKPPSPYPGPLWIRLGTTDLRVLEHVIKEGSYEIPWTPARSPQWIVDAGENIGFPSIYFAVHYPTATILAVEPESDNFELLRKNCQFYPNVVPIKGALSNVDGSLRLHNPGRGSWSFQVSDGGTGEPIASFTIPSLMSRFNTDRLDILKMDIEGSEFDVLDAACQQWLGSVDTIAIELHERYRPGVEERFKQATAGFRRHLERGETTIVSRW